MIKVLVTGATGFIGQHVIPLLIEKRYNVVAVSRDERKAGRMPWRELVEYISCDIKNPGFIYENAGCPDILIHLAWSGLPHYQDLFHYEENLPVSFHFIRYMIGCGVKHILVAGTCLEYGMQSGMLSENTRTDPVTAYGIAKDTLRKLLQLYQKEHPFNLQWVRLFYTYGPGQSKNSLIAQLDIAVKKGETVFNMSGGEQLRDYLPIEEVARRIVLIAGNPGFSGIINCCSGYPISIRRLVEEYVDQCKYDVQLNLNYYSYPTYEPMAFWGDAEKINSLLKESYNSG